MKKLSAFLFVILLLTVHHANAQYDFNKVDAWLNTHNAEMGGRTYLIVFKDGKTVYANGVSGMNMRQKFVNRYMAKKQGKTADLDDYTATTRQPIASCSKWLSAALIMTFVDEGKLKLTDSVGKYLPVLTKHGKGNITIADCLSHLTGIDEPALKERLQDLQSINTMDEAVEQIANMPMDGEPGKTFHYSNAGLQIAGAIIEKISGKSFETLFAERIAGPCNMKNTDFGNGHIVIPAGSGISTPQDYLNFLTMILNKGTYNGKRILSENSIAQMQIDRITPAVKVTYKPEEAGNFGYGFGEWIMGNNVVSSPGLFGSFPWVDNDKHYAAFMMTYYLKSTDRHKRYVELANLVGEAMNKN